MYFIFKKFKKWNNIILILDAPVFVAAPVDRVGDAGERIELECRVDSNPQPTYSWIRNDLPSVVSNPQPTYSWIRNHLPSVVSNLQLTYS